MSHDASNPSPPLADREACLAILSRRLDGRPVSAEEQAAAEARLAADPECAAIWADFQTAHASLASEPPVAARAGFAERVLAAQRDERTLALPFVRRLAVAASLAMLLTAGFGLARPGVLVADPGVEREYHHIDLLKASPYAPADLEAGLDALLRDSDPHRRLAR